ncbi:MAG: polysaccharide biosynthesis protein [Bacteroides sp.]|nr:polysaccharide biosynthesis protein [Bacteroides sp.]MCM1549383.1 polysaccharide biosynthesis protein [Clostridium sp.]
MSGTNESRRKNFLVQGGILAIAGIIVRMIGMIYRVPLTHIIGDRGNSLYDSAYSVYSIILIISSYSLPVAVSKMVAAKNSRKEYVNADRIFRCSLIYAVIVGLAAAVFCYVAAPVLVKADAAVPVLQVLSPVIFFSAVLGTFRGLFQGQGTMIPTSISQIFEQIFNAIVSVLAAYLLVRPFVTEDPQDVLPARGAMGSTLGTGAGVLAGLGFVLLVYVLYRPILKKRTRKGQKAPVDSYSVIFKSIILTVTPMVLSATLYNVSPFIDNYMIYAVMEKQGYLQKVIETMHGIYTGKYLLMVNIPVAIANALSSAMLPNIAAAKSRGDQSGILSKAQLTIKVTMLIAIPCTVGLAVLGGPAIQLIFGVSTGFPTLAGELLLWGSSFVLFFALSTVTNAILQATDHLRLPVIHSVLALVVHCLLAFVFMWCFDMMVWGLVLSTIAFAVILCLLNCVALYRKIGFQFEWKKTFFIPALAALFMGGMCWGSYYVVYYFSKSNTVSFLVSVLLGILTYFLAIFLFNGVSEEELNSIPKGHVLVKAAKKLHLFH